MTGFASAEAAQARDFLGRCRGCELTFPASKIFSEEYVEVVGFTPNVERVFGVTFILLDPYHPLLEQLLDPACEDEVQRYRERLRRGSEPRISAVRTGGFALNPANLRRIPILVSPLANEPYSQGVLLAVPAHDAELFELARRVKLPIREVIHGDKAKFDAHSRLEEPWLGDGVLTNSGSFTSLTSKVGRERIITLLSRRGVCKKVTRFRGAVFAVSSPSAWGAPVPIVHCKRCGVVPLPESSLPLVLPAELPRPTQPIAGRGADGAESAARFTLGAVRSFLRASCPTCGDDALRDPDTIQPWLGRAWSYLWPLLPQLAGEVDGFGDPSGKAAASTKTASGGEADAAFSEVGGGGPEASASEEYPELPEDVDLFRVGSDSLQATAGPGHDGLDEPEASPVEVSEGSSETDGEGPAAEAVAELEAADTEDASGEIEAAGEAESIGSLDRGTENLEEPYGVDGAAAEPAEGQPDPAAAKADSGTSEPSSAAAPEAAAGENATTDAEPGREGKTSRRDRKARRREEPAPGESRETPETRREGGESSERTDGAEEDAESEADALERVSKLRPFASLRKGKLLPLACAFGAAARAPREALTARWVLRSLAEMGHRLPEEPMTRHVLVGAIRAHDAVPATASLPSPLDYVERFGSDALRLHILGAGPVERGIDLDPAGILRMQRVIQRIWRQLTLRRERGKFVSRRMLVSKHLLIRDVTQRLDRLKFHTAVSAILAFLRFLESPETTPEDMDRGAMRTFVILLAPFAPFLARELWNLMGEEQPLETAQWPVPSEELIHPPEREYLIYVDGKVRDRMVQPSRLEPEKLESRALARDKIREIVGTHKVARVIVVPERLVSIVLAAPAAK